MQSYLTSGCPTEKRYKAWPKPRMGAKEDAFRFLSSFVPLPPGLPLFSGQELSFHCQERFSYLLSHKLDARGIRLPPWGMKVFSVIGSFWSVGCPLRPMLRVELAVRKEAITKFNPSPVWARPNIWGSIFQRPHCEEEFRSVFLHYGSLDKSPFSYINVSPAVARPQPRHIDPFTVHLGLGEDAKLCSLAKVSNKGHSEKVQLVLDESSLL